MTRLELLELDAQQELKNAKRKLKRLAEETKGRAERTLRTLAEGGTINSLGELQNIGLQMDLACAELNMARRSLEMIQAALHTGGSN